MRIHDKALIKYFGKKDIDENSFDNINNTITLNFSFDMDEFIKILDAFPNKILNISTNSANSDFINSILSNVPDYINIKLYDLSKYTFDGISPENAYKVNEVYFSAEDKYNETIKIEDIRSKFTNLTSIEYPFLLRNANSDITGNITDSNQIAYLSEITPMLSLDPELLESYKEFVQNNVQSSEIVIGSRCIYNKKLFEHFSQRDKIQYYPACELKGVSDYSKYIFEGQEVIFIANNMSDVPLEVAEKLQATGVKCKIRMNSYDNSNYQNEDYSLDEYVQISKMMDELIGDIDENLPEEEKFKQIYERVTKYLVYDYPAAYPKTKEEKKYSKENNRNCRNLRNGLLEGKTVCAGYADILKNACLIKGLECEYIQGPVDCIGSKDNYLYKKKKERDTFFIVHVDDESVIYREYHAWNKIKINGVWYNCDPTWDRDEIMNGKGPKYALLSDDTCKKLGRPTVETLRHPCTTDMKETEKAELFSDLEPSEELVANNKVIEFENTVDEYGNIKQLPSVPTVMPWHRMMRNLKKFAKESKANLSMLIYKIREKINPDFDKTLSLPIQTIRDTEPIDTVENTEPLPVINDSIEQIPKAKKPSWELSQDELKAFSAAERRKNSEKNAEDIQKKDNERGLGE